MLFPLHILTQSPIRHALLKLPYYVTGIHYLDITGINIIIILVSKGTSSNSDCPMLYQP